MQKVNPDKKSEGCAGSLVKRYHAFATGIIVLIVGVIFGTSGCSPAFPPRLQANFDQEPDASAILQDTLPVDMHERYPISLALVLDEDPSQIPLKDLKAAWPQLKDRVKQTVQDHLPVALQAVILVDKIPAGDQKSLLNHLGENTQTEWVLVVLPSSQEVKGPAKFDVLPEVSSINGYQIENHTSMELGLLDLRTGRLLLHSQGTSYATLEKLDVPLASNRYPRVRGSGMTRWIYPPENESLETLRGVALTEALDQAVMKFSKKWRQAQIERRLPVSRQAGAES